MSPNQTKPWQVVAQLEQTNSKLAKEAIVAAAVKQCPEFFKGAQMAYDSLVTFGVADVPVSTSANKRDGDSQSFYHLAEDLCKRKLTGYAARDAIVNVMNQLTAEQWNGLYRRILIKDLRCGISEVTENKVCKAAGRSDLEIPVFQCQLAKDGADRMDKITGKQMIETKLDGVRVLTVLYPNGTAIQYSRNGKELKNFERIRSELAAVAHTLSEPTVLDGEVMSKSFQDLMRQVHRKYNVNSVDAMLYLFDMVPLQDFLRGKCNAKQTLRTSRLAQWHASVADKLSTVAVLEHEIVDFDTAQGRARFNEINRAAIDAGYEGLMINDVDAPYQCKRVSAWLKKKPVISVDLTVVELEQGTGKYEGMLGALICEGQDQGRAIRVNVGSGLTDGQRREIWDDPGVVVGSTVEILADAVTKSADSDVYSLRFPRFNCFRDDK